MSEDEVVEGVKIAEVNNSLMPRQRPGRSRQDYPTPSNFLDAVKRKFSVEKWSIDLAADDNNKVVPQYYGKGSCLGEDSLVENWASWKGDLWLNPPFGNIELWVRKAYESTQCGSNRIFVLVPASMGSNWFANWVFDKARVILMRPRLSFDGVNSYPKDLMLLIYGQGWADISLWDWVHG